MKKDPDNYKTSIWWNAPAYFDRWRVFPRLFIGIYLYLLVEVVFWFMSLPSPNMEQSALVSVIVGAGTAWFGLYVREPAKKLERHDNTDYSNDDDFDEMASDRSSRKRSIRRRIPAEDPLDNENI